MSSGLSSAFFTPVTLYPPFGTFGWSGAYGTHFWVDPENRITAILMRNMRWHNTHGAGEMGVEFERLVMQCA